MNKQSIEHHSVDRDRQVIKKTLQIIAGKWRLLIIYQLNEQDRRYTDLLRGTPGISDKVLMSELNELVAMGVLQKKVFNERPPRVEYSLTAKARTIIPLLIQLPQIGLTFLEP